MRKLCTICIIALIIISSVTVLSLDQEAYASPSPYSYSYDGYTVTQLSESKEGNVLTVNYSITGNGVTGSYTIQYAINGEEYSFATTNVSNVSSTTVIIVPPKIMNGDEEGYVGTLTESSSTVPSELSNITKLYLLTDNKDISMPANFVRKGYSSLTDLVIVANATVNSNLLNQVNTIQRVFISNYVTSNAMSGSLYNVGSSGDNQNDVIFEMKVRGDACSVKQLISKNISGSLTLKLLPDSTAVSSLDLTNVDKVLLNSADWNSNVAISALGSTVTGGSATIEFYGSSQATSYTVAIAQNQTGVSVDAQNASEGDVVTITLTPGQGKQVGAVSVVKENNESVQTTVDSQNPNVYTFVMPASDVTVSATFEDIPAVVITPASDTVAKGASTTVTVSAVGLKNVSSLYITITYDEAKFNLKSPAYSNLLSSAPLKGDLTKGEYVVAFATAQDISGDLLTFQLEAKDDAAVGACTISCTVEINGTASGNSNTPEHTYTDTSALTIGNVLGDLDSDGDVDEDDAVYLLLYTFRASTYPIPEGQNVDYNNDGVINSDDAIYLKNYVVNPTQYPLGGA